MKALCRLIPFLLSLLIVIACRQLPTARTGPKGSIVIENQYVTHASGADARNERFVHRRTGRNFATSNSPCAYVKEGNKNSPATAATFKDGLLTLHFADVKAEAVIRVIVKKSYFLWEVVSLTGSNV